MRENMIDRQRLREDFDKVLKKTNYTPTQLRKRIEDTFKAAGKKLGEVGKTN